MSFYASQQAYLTNVFERDTLVDVAGFPVRCCHPSPQRPLSISLSSKVWPEMNGYIVTGIRNLR